MCKLLVDGECVYKDGKIEGGVVVMLILCGNSWKRTDIFSLGYFR